MNSTFSAINRTILWGPLPVCGLSLSLLGHMVFGYAITQFDFSLDYSPPVIYQVGIVQEESPPSPVTNGSIEEPKIKPAKSVKKLVLNSEGRSRARPEKNLIEGPSVSSTTTESVSGFNSGSIYGDGKASPDYGINPKPNYPEAARRARLEGLVTLTVTVSEHGLVEDVKISSSSGASILDNAAVSAVKKWRFRPALISGHPATSTIDIPVRFQLIN